jgi:hypothetical protein
VGRGKETNLDVNGALHLTSTLFWSVLEPVYTPANPGARRVRVVTKGRGSAYDLVVDEPLEVYELTIWPNAG